MKKGKEKIKSIVQDMRKINKTLDLYLLMIWPLLAAAVCIFFQVNFLVGVLLFFAFPSLYLSFKIPGQVKKTIGISITLGLILSVLDYVCESTGGWGITSMTTYKILGEISVEAPLWGFLWVYFIVIFYEYFAERDGVIERTRKLAKQLLKVSFFSVLLLVFSLVSFGIHFIVPYSYFAIGFMSCLLPIAILYKYASLRMKFFVQSIYFLYAMFVYELTALALGHWYFPSWGQFIGEVRIFQFIFPLEEALFFIILGSVAILSYYEFFDDDRK